MAANASDYLEQNAMDHFFNKVTLTPPNTWVALYTVAPTDAGGGTEVTQGGAYARIKVNPNGSASGTWALAAVNGTGYRVDNGADITWATATDNWGTVTNVGILDASTGGNLLFHGALTASKAVNTDDVFKFPLGALDIDMV